MEGLTEGRMVHYVLPDGLHPKEHRPAVVVKVWDREAGTINLQVFTDGGNDGGAYTNGIAWKTSVHFSVEPLPNTWHWIEKA